MNVTYKMNRFLIVLSLLLTTLAPLAAADADSLFRVGYSKKLFSGVDLNDVQVAIDMWSAKLAIAINDQLKTNYRAVSSYLDKNQSVLDGNQENTPDLINITSTEYLSIKNQNLWEPLFCRNAPGTDPREQLLFLVPVDANRHSQTTLLEIADNLYRDLTKLWLAKLQRQSAGQPALPAYDTVRLVPKPSRAVLDVFFGKAAACIVNQSTFQTMIELNPQLEKKLRIQHTSPPLLFSLSCVRRDLSQKLKEKIFQAAITLPSNPTGQQLLKLFGGTSVQPFKAHYLDTVKALMKQNKQGQP